MIVNIISRNSPDNHYHESNNSFQPPARFPIANFRKFALVLRIGVPDVIVTMPTTHLFHEMMGYFNLVNTSHCHVSNSFNSTRYILTPHHHHHYISSGCLGKNVNSHHLPGPGSQKKTIRSITCYSYVSMIIRLLEQNGWLLKKSAILFWHFH